MLTLVLAQSALEVVPSTLVRHPTVVAYSKRMGRKPEKVLLDRSYHHAVMGRLDEAERRGRPDIIHATLLSALGTPLNKEGLLRIVIHTFDEHAIYLDQSVRIPRNYNRFVGLMEQLYEFGRVPRDGKQLLSLRRRSFREILRSAEHSRVIALSRIGAPESMRSLCRKIAEEEYPVVVVGGFPRGHFSKEVTSNVDEILRIDKDPLDAWVVASRVVYEFEISIGLDEQRLR